MTDIDKALKILKSTNDGNDLPAHQKKVVEAALAGDLNDNTGARLVFEDLYESLSKTTAEA